MNITVSYFDNPGKKNTQATMIAARRRADELGVRQVVVASTHGYTAREAVKAFEDTAARIVAVTLSGAWSAEGSLMTPDERKGLEAVGVTVLTSLHSLGDDVSESLGGGAPNEIVRRTLYTFGQGMKVAVECALMAADAGLLDMESDVISIAGTDKGADTAILMKPAFARQFAKLRIREILAMPSGV